MKGGVCRGAKKGGAVNRHPGEPSGGVRNSEGLSRSSPTFLVAGLPGSGLPPSSSTEHTLQTNDTFSHQARVYGTSPQGRFTYQEAPDVQQITECWRYTRARAEEPAWSSSETSSSSSSAAESTTSESVGAKADSGSSSFASTPSKRLRGSPVPKAQVKGDRLPTAALKHSLSLSNDPEMLISIEQEMDIMRQTIIDQEAVFREQVRELHRVHKVQTLLMEEMKKKDSDMLSFSSGIARGGSLLSPADFASVNPGGKRKLRSPLVGQFLENSGYSLQALVASVEPLKGGAEITRGEPHMGASKAEIKLFGVADRREKVPPVRRTFDLERPPEDDDDEQEKKLDEGVTPVQETIKFIGLPTSCAEPGSEVSLNLSTGWDRGNIDRGGRDFLSSSPFDEQERENSRVQKRPRELEEAPLLPLFAAKAETPVREAPLRPTPKVANQDFLGGLFHLQLGRKEETPLSVDINATLEESEVTKKPERLSFNLEVEEKISQTQPHWLFQDKPMKKAPGKSEAPTFSSHQPFFPSGVSDQEILKLRTSSQTEVLGSSAVNGGSVWAGERRASGIVPKSRPQTSHMHRQADDVQPGSVYRSPFLTVGGTTPAGPGYTSYNMGQGVGDGPHEGLTLYSSWTDGEGPKNGFPHGVFAPSHPLGAGGLSSLGLQQRSFEGHPNLATQGVVVGPAVNMGTGTAAFVADSSSGLWYQQRSSYSQYQQYQQQQQLASLQAQASSSQGVWQTPVHIAQGSQGGPYPQGAVYAIPTGAGSSIGLSLDSLRRMRDDLPGVNWPVGNVGPPFSTFSFVAPSKPPFKRPPKLVLTHDVTTMEFKLVSPEKGGLKNPQDKSFSGSSEEEVGDPSRILGWRENTSVDAGLQSRTPKDRDDNHVGYQGGAVRYPRGGKRERDERAASSPLKDKAGSPKGMEWKEKVASSSHSRVLAGRNLGIAEGGTNAAPEGTNKLANDGDGSDGGSGVGDVINPEERMSPPLGSFATVRNLPAREGAEILHLGEPGIQADSESEAMKLDRHLKSVPNMNRTSSDDKPRIRQELPQGQLAMSLASKNSLTGRKVPRESSDGPEVPLKRMKLLQSSTEEGEQALNHTYHYRAQEQSATSSGCVSNMPENGSRPHSVSPQFQGADELRNVGPGQRSSGSSSEPRANLMKLQEAGNHAKDRTKSTERQVVDMNVELTTGEINDDAEQHKVVASNSEDHMQEAKPGHSKQLSGASISSPVRAEKGGARYNAHSPGLHQVPSHKIENAEGQAEGSSIIVSQASETVQGNGRSPLRTGEWVGPTVMVQGHLGSSGGIKHSCEEVEGTLVERLRGGEMEQKGKDFCPEGNITASCNQKNLAQSDDAAMDTTDPSSSGMCISQTTTKTSHCVKGDPTPGSGVSKGEKQNAESRRTTALASEVDDGEADISGLNKHSNQPAVHNTEKPEGSLDGDKDSVNSSKSIHERVRINGGTDSKSGKVLPGHGVNRRKKLQDASPKSKALIGPAVLSACAPSPQFTVSSPPRNRRVPPVAVQEMVDEVSENPCDNSNLAATLLLSLAPKAPSLSGFYSKAEKERSLSFLERNDKSNDVVRLKREPQVVRSRPNSSPKLLDLDLRPSASIKCQIDMQLSGIPKENDRHTSLLRGERVMIAMDPQSAPKLDFFESVTLMLKESKLLKHEPTSGKDVEIQSSHLLHPRQMPESKGAKPLRKDGKCSGGDPGLKKISSRSRGSEGGKTRERLPGCKIGRGFHSDKTRSAETSKNRPGQGHGKNSGAEGDGQDIKLAISSHQVSCDQEGESSKGRDCSKGVSVDAACQKSFWGDASRRKRMQRPRSAAHSQGHQLVQPSRKVGH